MGGKVDRVTVTPDLSVDMDALLAAIARKPRMLMFSNPMNPVGSWLTPLQLAKVVAALDPETLIVVDEAYAEYAAGDDYPSAAEVLKVTGLNWVVLRTFSKAYGLAGLRIGYGIVSDGSLCDFFNRARTPFNTNAIAQVSALAAFDDTDHLNRSVELALVERERMKKELATMGYGLHHRNAISCFSTHARSDPGGRSTAPARRHRQTLETTSIRDVYSRQHRLACGKRPLHQCVEGGRGCG